MRTSLLRDKVTTQSSSSVVERALQGHHVAGSEFMHHAEETFESLGELRPCLAFLLLSHSCLYFSTSLWVCMNVTHKAVNATNGTGCLQKNNAILNISPILLLSFKCHCWIGGPYTHGIQAGDFCFVPYILLHNQWMQIKFYKNVQALFKFKYLEKTYVGLLFAKVTKQWLLQVMLLFF